MRILFLIRDLRVLRPQLLTEADLKNNLVCVLIFSEKVYELPQLLLVVRYCWVPVGYSLLGGHLLEILQQYPRALDLEANVFSQW